MTQNMETLVSVVAPLEDGNAAAVGPFVRETITELQNLVSHYEIILVDDGTSDATSEKVRVLLREHDYLRHLTLSRRFGEETAIAAGLEAAIGDYMLVMLPQHDPPALIPAFLAKAQEADIVYGVRSHRHGEPWWYRLGTRLFYWYMNSVLRAGLPVDSTQFRCMSRQVVNAIASIRDPDRYLRMLTSYVGFHKTAVVYSPVHRVGRAPARRMAEALGVARSLVMDHTAQPLRVASWGAVVLALGFVAFRIPAIPGGGRAALADLVLALTLWAMTVAIAVLVEYIIDVVRRSRSRPSYYVREEETSAVLLREDRRNVVDDTDTTSGTAR